MAEFAFSCESLDYLGFIDLQFIRFFPKPLICSGKLSIDIVEIILEYCVNNSVLGRICQSLE